MRLNIGLPDRLMQQIDAIAKARRMTRSALLVLAAPHEMGRA
ncbi:type II toxin-antitoxin system HicB family antitoxin [Ralstonia psammae]